MKKAQSISINTIIIAAIGLAVLVVLFAIFTGRIGGFSTGVKQTDTCAQKCTSLGMQKGTASTASDCSDVQKGQFIGGTYADAAPGVCCCF